MAEITSGVGRIVWGHPLKGRGKTNQQKQPVMKDGKQVIQWAFGVAFPKNEFGGVWQIMQQQAMTLFPSGQFPPGFAWKYDDGDGIDSKGQSFANREGYKGCIVLAISTEAFAPRVVRLVNGAYVQVAENEIKTGDFVRVGLDIKPHGPNPQAPGSQAGLYVNPTLVEFVGQGDEIVSGADPTSVFGGQNVALPPGARPIGSMPPASAAPLPIPSAAPAPMPMPAPAPMAPPMAMVPGNPPAPVMPAPVAAPPMAPPAAPPTIMPGGFVPPIASPSNPMPAPAYAPAPDFVQAAIQTPPPAPVAPVKQQWALPMGSAIPQGYRHVANNPDGSMVIELA